MFDWLGWPQVTLGRPGAILVSSGPRAGSWQHYLTTPTLVIIWDQLQDDKQLFQTAAHPLEMQTSHHQQIHPQLHIQF